MEPVVGAPDPGLDGLRVVRAELTESMSALELALAAPAPGRQAVSTRHSWRRRRDCRVRSAD